MPIPMLKDTVPLPSEITPRRLYLQRREFLRLGAGAALAGMLPQAAAKLGPAQASAFSSNETPTPL
ncbi:MAG TPA: hypothetical protein VJ001_12300, partial [Rhodocyclaceae bacterium]|nr:hypothetical protein [Rhodocyclaceae bacterium]